MINTRVIPCLLLKDKRLVKSIRFKDYIYLGDPINAVKIFSEKEVHELVFFDIMASKEDRTISLDVVRNIADECYMPFSVGGGIKKVEDIRLLLNNGAEKVVINTSAIENPSLIEESAEIFGSQSIVVCIDVKKKLFGSCEVLKKGGTELTGLDPVQHALNIEKLGAGEIIVNSIDRDGTMKGYDIEIIRSISDAVNIPVIACGGAGKIEDLRDAVYKGHASAVAAGSLFVFYGPRKAVLINFPIKQDIKELINLKVE